MILPKQELMELTGLDDSFDLDFAHRGVEKGIKNYCGWDIESTTYYNQLIDGTGSQWLWPGMKNITAVARIATTQEPVISIKHTTAAANAYARVVYSDNAATTLGLNVDGSAETTKALATYTTMTLLVAQITGSGWSAEIYNSDYNSFASTNLLEVDNISCGTWDGTDPGWEYLYMPGEPLRGYTVERTEGGVYHADGWPSGTKNIPITYTAGWTTANMPGDIKQAVAQFVSYFYNKQQQETTGIKSFSLGHLRIEYATDTSTGGASSIPIEVLDVLDQRYRIKVIV